MSLTAVGDEELLDYVIEKDFEDTVSRIILGAVALFPEGLGRVKLTRVLRGKDPGIVITENPELLDHFGRLGLLDEDQILDFIESLIRLSHLEIQNPDFPRLLVTKKGTKAIRSNKLVPAQIPWPLPSKNIPVPVDPEKYEDLREERNRLARDEGLPPYCVASNLSLVEMVNRGVERQEELQEVPGIGQGRMERFGEAFIKVLSAS
ncbi:MAG: HRDC domain-containing protein [Thermoplasmatota archaeon]